MAGSDAAMENLVFSILKRFPEKSSVFHDRIRRKIFQILQLFNCITLLLEDTAGALDLTNPVFRF